MPRPSARHLLHVRLSEAELVGVRSLVEELEVPVSGAVRLLLREALAARSRPREAPEPAGAGADELNLHLLVAIEQVIGLIESFVPRGRGAAKALLPEAVAAAKERLDSYSEGQA